MKARKGSGAWAGARGEEETGTETGRVAGRVAGTEAGTVAGGEEGPAGRVGERSVNRVVTGESKAGSKEERPGGGAAISESSLRPSECRVFFEAWTCAGLSPGES